MRLPHPTSRSGRLHFLWLLSAAAFVFAGVVWSGSKAHAVELSPAENAHRRAAQAEAERVQLLGRLQLAGIASRRAGPPRAAAAGLPRAPSPDEHERALARYLRGVGADSVHAMVAQSGSQLAAQVLEDDRITLASGHGDVASGRIDPRVLALLLYLAEAHGEVTVSCLITGHSRFVAQTTAEKKARKPRRVSAHMYGRAVDISSIGGVPVIGNQLPGGVVDRAVRDILSLPPALQPSQVISLLDLSGPSFRLPDHGDHLHIGY